jgi:hypothetical protein
MRRLDDPYACLPVPQQHAAVSAFGLAWHRKTFGGIFALERDGFSYPLYVAVERRGTDGAIRAQDGS